MWDLKTSDWVIATATLLGPILAVQAQKWLESWRRSRESRVGIFYSLMATRATRISPVHVEALNRIDLEFGSERFWFLQSKKKKSDQKVIEAWRLYSQHLSISFDEKSEVQRNAWNAKCDDLFFDLLYEMSGALGFKFTKSHLQQNAYYPKGHGWREELQSKVLEGAASILSGNTPLKMAVTEFPVSEEALRQQLKVQEAILSTMANGAVKVAVTTSQVGTASRKK